MRNKDICEFAIIRFVPKVEREEFINIGAIVLCQSKNFLKLKSHVDEKRLKVFAEDVDIELILEYLQAWRLVCEGKAEGGKIGELDIQVRFRWLTASRSTIIQSSDVHPGLCADPEKKLEVIYRKYVLPTE